MLPLAGGLLRYTVNSPPSSEWDHAGEDCQAPPGQSANAGQSRLRRGQFRLRRAEEPSLGTGYIVRVRKIGLIEGGYRDLVRKSRSRAGPSRDDCPSRHPGVVQARILFFETVASDKLRVE